MVLLRLSLPLPLLDTLSIRTARACILLRSTVARVLRRRIALWLVLIVRSRHYRIAARLLLSLTILLLIYSRRTALLRRHILSILTGCTCILLSPAISASSLICLVLTLGNI